MSNWDRNADCCRVKTAAEAATARVFVVGGE